MVRREVLGLQPGEVSAPPPATGMWEAMPVYIVGDTPSALISYTATGAQFGFPVGPWPTPDGLHPWHEREAWQGHGCLMVQRPEDHFAIWHFWDGPDRDFVCWYLNLQTSFVRTAFGYDTQDLELDIIVHPDGSHDLKDDEVLDDRVAEGRFSAELVEWIRAYGSDLIRRLETEGPWWDRSWAEWTPEPAWTNPRLPESWNQ